METVGWFTDQGDALYTVVARSGFNIASGTHTSSDEACSSGDASPKAECDSSPSQGQVKYLGRAPGKFSVYP
jgi:hypothetical protein